MHFAQYCGTQVGLGSRGPTLEFANTPNKWVPHPFAYCAKRWQACEQSGGNSQKHTGPSSLPCKERKDGHPQSW